MVDWSGCTNIEKVRLMGFVEMPDIRYFFEIPKCHLKSIYIAAGWGPKSVKAVVLSRSKANCWIRKLRVLLRGSPLGAFNELVERNRSLRSVDVRLSGSWPKNKHAIDIVKTFLKSPWLRKLQVSSSFGSKSIPEIDSICRALRSRRVCISVFEVSYLG